MAEWRDRLRENIQSVIQRARRAAEIASRDPDSVRVVIVTKYVSVEVARAVVELGHLDLGESRPQELWAKAAALSHYAPRWHLVGHLQRNKVRRTLPLTYFIHSVDSVRLLDELDRVAAQLGLLPRVLLEVNISGEATKHGFQPNELPDVVDRLQRWSHIQVCGLMTMSALDHVGEAAAEDYRQLRQLRDSLVEQVPGPHHFQELSMGMSRDFELAIHQGATMVRVGSAVFEGIEEWLPTRINQTEDEDHEAT